MDILAREHEVLKWGTHVPLLVAAIEATELPILELGSGRFSTPLLAAVALTGRRVVTADSDGPWLAMLEPFVMAPAMHAMVYVPDWDEAIERFAAEQWGVILVDHFPPDRRGRDASRLADSAEFLVLHDSRDLSCNYEYGGFPYGTHDDRFLPVTSVVSNKRALWRP